MNSYPLVRTLLLFSMTLAIAAVAVSQADPVQADTAQQPTVAMQMADMLHRQANGHSPTPEEIQAVEGEPGLTDPAVAKQLLPLLNKALADPDASLRRYSLAMLVGMQSLPDAAANAQPSETPAASSPDGTAPAPAPASAQPAPASKNAASGIVPAAGPAAYKAEVGKALAPAIPAIAARLIDDDTENRSLAATVLGGFAPDPPPAVFPPLLSYLKRDDAVGPVGLAVVVDLLQFTPVSDVTATAIARYLRRPDQTVDARSNLVEGIALKPNQSQTVNKALLSYMDSDDGGLRARVILSLPQLDLTPEVFADTRARVSEIAAGGQDSLQVVNAAKAVAGCWTAVKMTSGCPVY